MWVCTVRPVNEGWILLRPATAKLRLVVQRDDPFSEFDYRFMVDGT